MISAVNVESVRAEEAPERLISWLEQRVANAMRAKVEWIRIPRSTSESVRQQLWTVLRRYRPALADLLQDQTFMALRNAFAADVSLPLDDLIYVIEQIRTTTLTHGKTKTTYPPDEAASSGLATPSN